MPLPRSEAATRGRQPGWPGFGTLSPSWALSPRAAPSSLIGSHRRPLPPSPPPPPKGQEVPVVSPTPRRLSHGTAAWPDPPEDAPDLPPPAPRPPGRGPRHQPAPCQGRAAQRGATSSSPTLVAPGRGFGGLQGERSSWGREGVSWGRQQPLPSGFRGAQEGAAGTVTNAMALPPERPQHRAARQ